jgi:hypothetical protein
MRRSYSSAATNGRHVVGEALAGRAHVVLDRLPHLARIEPRRQPQHLARRTDRRGSSRTLRSARRNASALAIASTARGTPTTTAMVAA